MIGNKVVERLSRGRRFFFEIHMEMSSLVNLLVAILEKMQDLGSKSLIESFCFEFSIQ